MKEDAKDDTLRCALPEVVVPPGESANVISDPVSPLGVFFPTSIEVDPGVAPDLLVSDVKVGKNSQLVACGCLPCSLFAVSPSYKIMSDGILPGGMRLVINITNVGPRSLRFRGWVLGSRKKPTTDLLYMIGFGYTEVKEAAVVTCQPQVAFHPRVLHVPPHVLDAFEICSLKQGKYLDTDEVPYVDASQLSEDKLRRGGEIEFKPVSQVGVSVPISVTVTRKSREGSLKYFSAAILGTPVPS